jgi:FAD/FMN-containing dehydrogenase
MMSIQLKSLGDEPVSIADDQLNELRMLFRGQLLTAADNGYEEARVVHNAAIDRRPGLIVRCSGTADVVDAVNLARERNLLTAVRGGGHHVAGHCTVDDGVMIDLSAMRSVWVDPVARRVRVQGGATWGEVDREAQLHGLAVPGGVVSTTGVAGLTLGGGIGWLHRKWGLTCDSLRRVEIVTADGKVLRASEKENADLFWGVRGGGGNFGVVTSFDFEAYPLGPIVMCVGVMYPFHAARETFRAWRDWAETTPDEVSSRVIFWWLPDAPTLPPAVRNQHVMIVGAVYAGDPQEGERVLRPARRLATPMADISAQMPFRFFQAAFDPLMPKGKFGAYWKSVYLRELSDDAIDFVAGHGMARLSPLTLVHVPQLGGAISRVGPEETPIGDRDAPYMLSVDGNWADPAQAEAEIAWVRRVVAGAERFSTGGTYLNFGGQEDADVPAAFGKNLRRLAEVKKKYDPLNLFRVNWNIAPA